jgi:DNA-binding MarR family transcriptional regulator
MAAAATPHPSAAPAHAHRQTFHLLRRVMQEHSARWQARLPELTKLQYSVLRAVAENPGIEQSSVAVAAGTDKATLATLLPRLEQRGLLVRTVDAADRRRRLLELTDTGARELASAVPTADAVDAELLGRLSLADRAELQRILAALAGEMKDPPAPHRSQARGGPLQGGRTSPLGS